MEPVTFANTIVSNTSSEFDDVLTPDSSDMWDQDFSYDFSETDVHQFLTDDNLGGLDIGLCLPDDGLSLGLSDDLPFGVPEGDILHVAEPDKYFQQPIEDPLPAPSPDLSATDKIRTFAQQQQQQQQQQQEQKQEQQLQQQQQQQQSPIIVAQQRPPEQQSNPISQNVKQQPLLVVVSQNSNFMPTPAWLPTSEIKVVQQSVKQQPVVLQGGGGAINITSTAQVTHPTSSITTPTLPGATVTTLTTTGMNSLPISPPLSLNGMLPQLPKGEKRVAHNAIEKRYRRSINDRIETLRQMVVGTDTKIQKSGILQNAIDHINYLRKLSHRLKQENKQLKATLNRMKGAASVIIKAEPPTPPASDTQSPGPSPQGVLYEEMEDYDILSPKSEGSGGGTIGMTDRTRFSLCIFMFAVLLFNPFGLAMGRVSQGFAASSSDMNFEHGATGRTLQGVASEEDTNSPLWDFAMSSSVWFVNALLILGVIIQILIKGEPVTKPNSEASTEYWKHRRAAETEISRNEHGAAMRHVQLGLNALGRSVPVSGFDMWACSVWNFLRFLLNKVFIGRWLAKRAGGYEKDESEDGKYTTAETSARDAALLYLQYLQIGLVSNQPLSAMSVTSIGLVALNLAHCAGSALSCENIAELYATVALAIKETYMGKLKFVSRYFFSKGRTYSKEYSTASYLNWMNNAMAYKLVKQEDIPVKPRKSLFSQATEPNNPLSCLTQGLHEHMLEEALYQIVAPMEKSGRKTTRKSEHQDAPHVLTYLENPDGSRMSSQDTFGLADSGDVCKWWAQILIVATHWMQGDEEAAERRYCGLEKFPVELEQSEDTLPKAALMAFKARKLLMSNHQRNVTRECHSLCEKASGYLQRSVNYPGPLRHERLHEGIHLLVADWLLATRTTLWQKSQPRESCFFTQLASAVELTMFQQDLSALRRVAGTIKSVMPKVYLYQAVVRFMAGANPAQTQQLLDRSLRQKVPSSHIFSGSDEYQDYTVSKRDRGQALAVACRHLPESVLSYPNQRERMLNEAARCFEQAGDQWGLSDCQQMLTRIKKECVDTGTEISRQTAFT